MRFPGASRAFPRCSPGRFLVVSRALLACPGCFSGAPRAFPYRALPRRCFAGCFPEGLPKCFPACFPRRFPGRFPGASWALPGRFPGVPGRFPNVFCFPGRFPGCFPKCFQDASWALPGRPPGFSQALPRRFPFPGASRGVSWMLPGHFPGASSFTGALPGRFPGVSTARLAGLTAEGGRALRGCGQYVQRLFLRTSSLWPPSCHARRGLHEQLGLASGGDWGRGRLRTCSSFARCPAASAAALPMLLLSCRSRKAKSSFRRS